MALNAGQLDAFGLLAQALGILDENGNANSSWFGNPVGGSDNPHGLRDVLGDDAQRAALIGFVDEVLGPPERATRDGAAWVPLFVEASPNVTIYVVLEPAGTTVRLGIGIEHTTAGTAPSVATRVHVPLFQFARGDSAAPPDADGLPGWLLIGKAGGRVGITIDATLAGGLPAPGAASLGGLAASLLVPTSTDDQLGIRIDLRDLQLPGASAPRTFTLDAQSLDELGPDVFELLVGLVRAQASALDLTDPLLRPFAGLTGMLGLRDVPGIRPLPLADLPTQGLAAVIAWFGDVFRETASRKKWIDQLALLFDTTPDATRDAVTFTFGDADVAVGVRVQPGSAGHAVVTPWVEITADGRAGARVRLTADLLRADLSSGAVTAFPDLRAEAVFGVDAGGTALISGDPGAESLHIGLALTQARRPKFVMTLHNAKVLGLDHEVLDLSSPGAALDSASTVINTALTNALNGLGAPGGLVSSLLGIQPPAGVTGVRVAELLANPVAEVTAYWNSLTANAAATATVLGDFRRLVAGTAAGAVPGSGSALAPWRISLAGPVELAVWREADELSVDVRASVTTPVLGDLAADAEFGFTLLRATLTTPAAQFGTAARGVLMLRRADGHPSRIDVGDVALEFGRIAIVASWTPANGFVVAAESDGVQVTITPALGVPVVASLPLPRLNPDGTLSLGAPDWDEVQAAITGLLDSANIPVIEIALRVLGWTGSGARLRLAGLLGTDPQGEIEAWLAELLLDCSTLRAALRPVASLLSGFQINRPFGVGSARRPFRCPIAGEPRAPGFTAWLVPDCRPVSDDIAPLAPDLVGEVVPESADVVFALNGSARMLPDVADLLVGRISLAQGLDLLAERFTGTDGLVGPPATMPDTVQSAPLDGLSYADLVAMGSLSVLLGEFMPAVPTAVMHVGCEASWLNERAAGTTFDATAAAPSDTLPATGDGTWFLRLPTPAAAATARPDRGAVGEQAARLTQVLSARTEPIVLVGYGACGAAVIRAAATLDAVSDVVTVGTPWAGFAVDAFTTGLSGDALRFLDRLNREDAEAWSEPLLAFESSELQTMRGVVERVHALMASGDTLPSAESESRRAGLPVYAVFGVLEAETVARGIAALAQDGIAHRFEQAAAVATPHPAHTELHVGVDIPVFDLDLGGLLVGAGATLELCSLARGAGGAIEATTVRGLAVNLHLGVHDGWLVGGPGASQPHADLRWMSVRVSVPFDGRPGDTELALHEARAFSAYRERWVVRADGDGNEATVALPEVRAMLSLVVSRLRDASPDLATLLDVIGIVRNGGLDADALDRLLFDPKQFVATLHASAHAQLASALRALVPSATGTASALSWSVGPATLSFDLAAKSAAVALHTADTGLPELDASVRLSPSGATAELALGSAAAGGMRLIGRAGASNTLAIEWQVDGGAATTIALLPTLDSTRMRELVTTAVPAALVHTLATHARAHAQAGRAALDSALDALGLLTLADEQGMRSMILPVGLIGDPRAWLRNAVAAWRTAPAATAVQLLDALAPIVAPARGATPGWPLAPGVVVQYTAAGGRLRLAADITLTNALAGSTIATNIAAGLSIGPSGPPQPVLATAVTIDGRGLRLEIAPDVRVFLDRPLPATPLQLYPGGPGLGSALTTAGETALPPLLDAIAARRNDAAASMQKDVGAAVFELGGALDLLDAGAFKADRLTSFAADPSARLVARIPYLAASAATALARALDPTGDFVAVTNPSSGVVTLVFGDGAVGMTLDGSAATPVIVLHAQADLPGVGRLALDGVRLSADGLQVAARIGPASMSVGGFTLRPLIMVRAGVASGTFTRVLGIGLATDVAGATAVEFRWALDASPPSLVVVTHGSSGETLDPTSEAVASRLLAIAAAMATGILVDELGPTLQDSAKEMLRGVVFTDVTASTTIDAALFTDLFEPARLLARLERLLWNAATGTPRLEITIDTVTIGLVGAGSGDHRHLGIQVALADNQRFEIAGGDLQVHLEVEEDWINPAVPRGLSVLVIEGDRDSGGNITFAIAPSVMVGGIGLRFSKASGPLLDLGAVSLDAIAFHAYGEAGSTGVGGGVQLQLDGFAIAPMAGGGNNAVANSIMNDAAASGAANRPAFSPALAIQHHPGDSGAAISLRAGDPPGPWWVFVQRQLGPLYIEQVGFNTVEQNGRIVRVSLLFDGRVSIFGLNAAVDQLSFTWQGNDFFDVRNWQADLMGLAVSADFSGVSLAGGLLKTDTGGQISYVGMLLGRFGVYGLTVFGGYTDDHGSPSFFVFGAVNGPIGGPPAFFLTGIGGGLGINRGLRVPTDLSRFNEYPFIQALDPAARPPEDPLAALRRLNDYFPPVRGNFWFAAGISFTCFALVDGVAVVAVSFGDGLDINLLGLARMALPRPQAALVSIELGLVARFSTREGVFAIRAQLTENSWLLYEDVRLTGGYALVTWWKGPNRGQFVLTLGGYHPSFHRDGYPEVPRLGLTWQVTSQIVVKGGAYFALTSEALMAGVDVEVSANFGWAWARIGFGAHGIVYFDPFWFEVMAYARISAGVKISTWLGTVRFSISTSADIRVWGPEFSGEATLRVGPASVTVGFGSERVIPKRVLEWPEFIGKYLEDAGGAARALASITGRGTLPAATNGDVAAPTSDGSRERPFEVYAEFELTITTTVPAQRFEAGAGRVLTSGIQRSDGAPAALGLKPMKAGSLVSSVQLTLERLTGATTVPAASELAQMSAELATDAFPIGVWGVPEPDNDEAPLPKGDVLFAPNQIRLTADATPFDRGPEIEYRRVDAGRRPLPLQAGGTTRPALINRAGLVEGTLPAIASVQQALEEAGKQLFVRGATDLPAGVLPRGAYSNLARAAYVGDRMAPPLFGSLADGLAEANADDPASAKLPVPEPEPFPGLRPPVVAAVLTSGAGVAPRADVTTVSNRRTARRPAPSLASVQTRIAMHLPIRMVVTPPPAAPQRGTVIPNAAVPRTDAPGTARTYVAGRTGGIRGLDAMVAGLGTNTRSRGRAKAAGGPAIRPGDLIVMRMPDAAIDVDAQNRPALAIGGTARVVMLKGNGTVATDTSVADSNVTVPPGVAVIGVQAGGNSQSQDGLAGWHASARIAALGADAALAAGCVLTIEAADAGQGIGWAAAAEVVANAGAVNTHFTNPVRTVAVILADADPQRLDGLQMELLGARRAKQADGSLRPPTVVLRGSEAALIFAIEPERRATVTVRVVAGGDWRLAGVMGGNGTVESVARVMLQNGPLAIVRRILTADTGPGTVTWQPASPTRGPKKKTAKKQRRRQPAGTARNRGK